MKKVLKGLLKGFWDNWFFFGAILMFVFALTDKDFQHSSVDCILGGILMVLQGLDKLVGKVDAARVTYLEHENRNADYLLRLIKVLVEQNQKRGVK